MKTGGWRQGLAGMVLMSLALACEQKQSPTALARHEGISSEAEVAADPTLIAIDVPGAAFSDPHDIGPSGDIVGRYATSDGKTRAFLLHQGGFTTIEFSATYTDAFGINGGGDIVGRYQSADAKFHGFLLSDGTFTSLDVPGAAATSAFGINSRGDIVGSYCSPTCPSAVQRGDFGNHGFLLHEGSFSSIDVPNALLTQAWKINAAGQVSGRYKSPDGQWHAFVMSDAGFTSIDVPGAIQTASFPSSVGINAAGDIVGSYCSAAPCPVRVTDNLAAVHGFLLRREDGDNAGQVTTIDFPGASGTGATGINARGDVVGVYADASHRVHGFLRSP